MEQKAKRNTKQRTTRTFGQAVIGGILSWTLVEQAFQHVLPVLQHGDFKIAAIGALGVVLTAVASAVNGWFDNSRPDRKNSTTVED